MADPFLDDESSEQDGNPIELIEITYGNTTHRITTGVRDVLYNGAIYAATAAARGVLAPVGAGNAQRELEITLPVNHAFVRRYLQQGVPPGAITATLIRRQARSGLVETQWTGPVTSMSVSDDNASATFRCPARLGEALLRVIPNVSASRLCVHVLYDATCAISRTGTNPDGIAFKQTATVTYVSGRTVRFDLSNVPANNQHRADWLVNGELVHPSSGERRTIATQSDLSPGFSTVTQIEMQHAIPELKLGDTIEAYAGCRWDVDTCDLKFNNLSRMGGYPYMPTKNPHVPGVRLEVP